MFQGAFHIRLRAFWVAVETQIDIPQQFGKDAGRNVNVLTDILGILIFHENNGWYTKPGPAGVNRLPAP